MAKSHPLSKALQGAMIRNVPSYGNKFFYSLGFLSMISFVVLIVTGIIMTFFGPGWWLTTGIGGYVRSVHMWSTQAFVIFMILHLLVVFLTSGFKKPRRLTWVIGVIMLFIALAETELGYALRGDFSSQWRSLQGADFYNGSGLGDLLNPLNYNQIFGIHIIIVPLAILCLLALHYLLVRVLGIATPYRKGVVVKTVPANHALLFARGGVLTVLILVLAFFLPSPYVKPTTIQSVAQKDPFLTGQTLMAEFTGTSDTATYLDGIDPYNYDTKLVYVAAPYASYLQSRADKTNQLTVFDDQPAAVQAQQLKAATDYYAQDNPDASTAPAGPLMAVMNSLTTMAQAGLYEPVLVNAKSDSGPADVSTYAIRFLADTGVLEAQATLLNMTTEQYGMIREEAGSAPGAWWLAPIGLLNHTVLVNDDNGDRDAAIIFGSLFLTMMAFPFIPYLNQIPDKLKVYPFIWRQKK
ncbi:MAG: cytochrome b N-terminal domain-containing protein [Candidatus Saccharibacteria bacterium]